MYKPKLKVWVATPVEKAGAEAFVVASLPSCTKWFKRTLQDEFFVQGEGDDLTKVKLLEIVENWLKEELSEDNMCMYVRVWSKLEALKQKPDENVEEVYPIYVDVKVEHPMSNGRPEKIEKMKTGK